MKEKVTMIVLLMWLCSWHMRLSGQELVHFNFDGQTGDVITSEVVTGSLFPIVNHFNKPEFVNGVSGTALRLDGYSTWASKNFAFSNLTKQLSVEGWFTTEAFTAETAAIISQENSTTGFSLEVGSYGNVSFSFHADGNAINLKTNMTLMRYKWNHIVATVDLSLGEAHIFVNGDEWETKSFATTYTKFDFIAATLYLGRHSTLKQFAGFNTTVLNGAIDEVVVYNTLLTQTEIVNHYQAYSQAVPDLQIDPVVRYANDYFRPRYHPIANSSWMNECYGLIFYNGRYHLFFQKNPNGPYLYFMHWGHLTSPDLVNWTEEEIPLTPSVGFDSFGVWSGTTIADSNGNPVIVYTGVDGAKAGIGIAYPNDSGLMAWTKYAGNPVIAAPPISYASLDFRDPYVWKTGDAYYMIVGSGLQNSGGGILFTYKSTDLMSWQSIAPLYRDSNIDQSGVFWEMPFFYRLNETEYLLEVLPTPAAGKPARSLYWIGTFQNDKFTPYFTKPKNLELINENLLAPAIGTDEVGRTTYIGIIPEDRDVQAQVNAGWRHTFSLPRQIRLLEDSTIGHVPHPNVCRLHGEATQIQNRIVSKNSSFNISEVQGNQIELDFNIKADSLSRFSIQVYKNPDAQEFTSLVFDLATNKISLDRTFSTFSLATKDNREVSYVFDYKDTIDVKIFLDHSILEVFVENVVVFSCRVYPSRETSNKIDLIVNDGGVEIIQLNAWQMNDMNFSTAMDVCEIPVEKLPIALRKPKKNLVTTGILKQEDENKFQVFPNPTESAITIHYAPYILKEGYTIAIYTLEGNLIQRSLLSAQNQFSLGDLPSGIYYVIIENEATNQYFKIVKK
jgi:sucrose-6-phosphate hydrolase SacC (GH32 family)